MTILELTLTGAPLEIGLQHARQVAACRALLRQVIANRMVDLVQLEADRPAELQPATAALQEIDAPLLQHLAGLAEGLNIDYADLLRYTLSSYLRDRNRAAGGPAEGCTTWAAAPPVTSDGQAILAKNRDYHRDHIPLQTVACVQPAGGYRYLCIGSAGIPTVFSSGINERGLAVADTHVLSADLGPGLPRFSLMREILEHHASTTSALDYLSSVQHMGGGTLILADASGHLAVCESGQRCSGYVAAHGGRLVSTNHFTTAELADCWVEDEPPLLQGNSLARGERVGQALDGAAGRVDLAWAQAIMAAHGTTQSALCRHPLVVGDAPRHPSYDTSTISSVIYLPSGLPSIGAKRPSLLLAAGQPCEVAWTTWSI
jgi:hypothetical protein